MISISAHRRTMSKGERSGLGPTAMAISRPSRASRARNAATAAPRGLDRWADDEKPIGRRVGARLALDEPQCLEGQRKAAFAEALRFEHRLAERPAMPWPDNFKMTEPGPAEDLRCGWIAGERGG